MLLCHAAAWPLHGAETAELTIAQIQGSGWQASDIRLKLTFVGGQPALSANVGRLQLEMMAAPIEDVTFLCPVLRLTRTGGSCAELGLRLELPDLGAQQVSGSGSYNWARDQLAVELRDVRLAGGLVAVSAALDSAGWRLTATGRELSFAAALALWPGGADQAPISGEGSIALRVVASGRGSELDSLSLRADAEKANVSNSSGTLASDGLGAAVTIKVRPSDAGWQGSAEISETRGQLYLEPVFLDLTTGPVTLSTQWLWRGQETLELSELNYAQPGVLVAQGALIIGLTPAVAPLEGMLRLNGDGAAYARYLRPWWFGTPLESLDMSGPISGQVRIANGALGSVSLAPAGLTVTDSASRVEIAGLAGQLHWSESGGNPPSQLSWLAAHVYGLPLSGGSVAFQAQGGSLSLPDGLSLGTLGGQLIIDELSINGLGTETPDARFAARIDELDLGQLTAALKWPSFQGTLSGVLPQLDYRNGEAVVGGTLRARAFDGDFTLANLRVSGPFGAFPQLFGDLTAARVDLEQLTRTASFGRITGRADLAIKNLHLLAWSPVAFSARLATTPGDTSKHRISQQAIDNISAVSGGPTGLLSGGFMGLFEEFGYAQLGLSCRLENGICHMGGVAPARDGYYIVRGKGLPRIDVVGFKTEVDWGRLVTQLQSISRSRQAVVE
jgi:hypothetical protein